MPDAPAVPSGPTLTLRPKRGWQPIDFAEVWHYRELLWFLAMRDVKVRYKQTALGAAWAVLQPLAAMLVFSLFFGRLARLPSEGIAYPLFAYAGLLPWRLFANALSQASNGLIENEALITKVYFPRIILPLAAIVSSLVDFGIALLLLVAMMLFYGVAPWPGLLLLPGVVVLVVITALAVGLWFSAMNAYYRDFRYTIPFMLEIWLFLSPVVYSSTLVPETWRWLYGLNPMAGVIDAFRWSLLGTTSPPGPMWGVSLGMVALLLIGGAFFFRRLERNLADWV